MIDVNKHAVVFAEGLDHPECIAVHPLDGSVWAGGEAGQIYRMNADGSDLTEVANSGGFVLGIGFNQDGSRLAVCDLHRKSILELSIPDMKWRMIGDRVAGHNIQIPNYPVYDRAGRLYLSESGAFREVNGKILRFSTEGEGTIWCHGPFNFANGLALDESNGWLYVVCSWLPGVERIRILGDGCAGEREVYCTLPKTVPDGLALAEDGSLYISCYTPNTIYHVATDRTITVWADDWEGHTLANPTNMALRSRDMLVANLGRWHITSVLLSKTEGASSNSAG